ncbi:putative GEM-like protein 8 [Triticum dicoccoides]|uniref:putative GEM-like protein 8 n=1 Tax=Triticum dicoccoides TaxID=85692 RepID=UPI00189060EE|nr:putative GEM-like protein 8 [Triticum dicoccoides]
MQSIRRACVPAASRAAGPGTSLLGASKNILMTLGPKLYETVRGKLSLGARILQAGGVEKVFQRWFSVEKGEKLLKASQCYLSTTAGPIAGMLFVSTEKVAFRSDRSLALTSPKGQTVRVPYKVAVPLRRVKAARPSENQHRPEQKYVQLVTDDDFEFWFMGFVSYQASLQHLEQVIGMAGGGNGMKVPSSQGAGTGSGRRLRPTAA